MEQLSLVTPNVQGVVITTRDDVSRWGNGEGQDRILMTFKGMEQLSLGTPNFQGVVITPRNDVSLFGNGHSIDIRLMTFKGMKKLSLIWRGDKLC